MGSAMAEAATSYTGIVSALDVTVNPALQQRFYVLFYGRRS